MLEIQLTNLHPALSKLRVCTPPTIPSCELHLNTKSSIAALIVLKNKRYIYHKTLFL
jgi:hypothetical protein